MASSNRHMLASVGLQLLEVLQGLLAVPHGGPFAAVLIILPCPEDVFEQLSMATRFGDVVVPTTSPPAEAS